MGLMQDYRPVRKKRPKKNTKFRQYKHMFHGRELTLQGYEKQALSYLVDKCGIEPDDIRCECEFGDSLQIRYKYRGRVRTYLPDIYVVSKKTVVEVKSVHTLGLLHNKKRGFSMTQAKAQACHERGFKFVLLLLDQKGNRIKLPKNWPLMTKTEVVAILDEIVRSNPRGLFQA